MRRTIFIFFVVILFASCNTKKAETNIEKFVLVQHDFNWINDTSNLQAERYIEYIDSAKVIKYAINKIDLKRIEFYSTTISDDTLAELIYKHLNGKLFPECLNHANLRYDGDYRCLIYKFKNEPEHVINYINYNYAPDSMRIFLKYLENLTDRKTFKRTNSFHINQMNNKNKESAIKCFTVSVKCKAPIISDN